MTTTKIEWTRNSDGSAGKSWKDYKWPSWVTNEARSQIVGFWSESYGRGPKAWIESAIDNHAFALGERVILSELCEDGYREGRFVFAWNNIARLVNDEGRLFYVSFPRAPEGYKPGLVERFWSYVDRAPGQGPEGRCWLWQAGLFENGYGQFRFGRRKLRAHRLSFALVKGDPGELRVCHVCDTPRCVYPSHLFLGTDADNVADRDAKGRHRVGRKVSLPGEANPHARLTRSQVERIREMRRSGALLREIKAEVGVSLSQASAIASGKSWR